MNSISEIRPLICEINRERFAVFAPLLSEDMRSAFASDEKLNGFGAVIGNTPVGAIIFNRHEFMYDIRYLFVSDEYRRKRVASHLLNRLCSMADDGDMTVVVDFFVDGRAEDDERVAFFESLYCFSCERSDQGIYEISRMDLTKCLLKKYIGHTNIRVGCFFDLPKKYQNMILSKVGITADIVGYEKEAIRSLCLYTGTPDHPGACIFTRRGDNENIAEISYLWGDSRMSKDLIQLTTIALERFWHVDPEIDYVRCAVVNEESKNLLNKVFPKRTNINERFSAVWDVGDMPVAQDAATP